MIRIGIVAGEASGDRLAAELIGALRQRLPDAHFEGIAGPAMVAAGCQPLYGIERLSVMGLTEVARHLPGLLRLRGSLRRHFSRRPPSLFIGVDAPDFNLGLEAALRRAGIRTAHVVSPSIWAWRQGRMSRIARAVDLMLTLFPFEAEAYEAHGVPVCYMGHPLADRIGLEPPDPGRVRDALGLPGQAPVLALLPGSRVSEVRRLAPSFIMAARAVQRVRPDLQCVLPLANQRTATVFRGLQRRLPQDLALTIRVGDALPAMAAADVVMVASGTATLEALLLKRPMVVAYRVSPITARLLRPLLRVEQFALPNLLAGRALVPELIQDDARPEALMTETLRLLDLDAPARSELLQAYEEIHQRLRRNASARAAAALTELLP